MRTIVFLLLFWFALSGPLRLNLDNSIIVNPGQTVTLPLSCTGSTGQINYQAKGLPKGLSLINGVIQGTNEASNGYYPVIIDARDERNNFVSQIIVFKIGNAAVNTKITLNSGSMSTSAILNQNNGISSLFDASINRQINTNSINSNGQNMLVPSSPQSAQNTAQVSSPINQNGSTGPQIVTSVLVTPPSSLSQTSIPSGSPQIPQISVPTPATQVPLQNLLDKLAPISSIPAASPSMGNPETGQYYPTANLPTSPGPDAAPNMTPAFIEAAKAPRLPSDRNKITSDSVKATAIFQRQLSSNKAIANLLDIIEQLTANTNAAKLDMPILDSQVKNAVAIQRESQSKIITAENQRSRLNNAINNLNDNINMLRKQLTDLQNSLKDSAQNVASKKIQLVTLIESVQKYENSAKTANDRITKQKDIIQNASNQIKQTQNQIQANKLELDNKNKQAANIDSDIDKAVKNIKSVDEEIADLKARLNAALKRKTQAQDEQKRLRDIKVNAPIVTAQLQRKILKGTQSLDKLNQQKINFNNQLTKLNADLDQINLNMGRVKSQLSQIQTEIKVSTGNGQDYDNAISAKNKQIVDSVANLQFLKSQVQPYQTALRNAYNEGNDANAKVQNAKENLDALVKKWEKDSQSLSQATLNLEKARAQKQLSDLAMQQLLRQRSNALPYSVVPNGNGLTNAGTPSGNNPRGSPLGPLAINNNQNSNNPFESQASKLSSFNNYLSSAYAQGVDPTIPSSVTKNFPFTIYKSNGNNGNSQLRDQKNQKGFVNVDGAQIVGLTQDNNGVFSFSSDFSCGSTPSDLIDGIIRAIGSNVLNVQATNGRNYIVKVGSCSQAVANSPNYAMSIGDKIKFSGQSAGMGIMNLYQATCQCSKCEKQK